MSRRGRRLAARCSAAPATERKRAIEEDPAERFARRRAQWGKLNLRDADFVASLAEQDYHAQERQALGLERNTTKLDVLVAAQDVEGILALCADLTDNSWEYSITCLVKLFELDVAWKQLQASDGVEGSCWKRSALAIGTAALSIDGAGEVYNRTLAKTITAAMVERRLFDVAAALLLEFAIADAQTAVKLIESAREAQELGEDSGDSQDMALTSAFFERALDQLRRVEARTRDWGVVAGEVTRWNLLLRLMAKQRRMPTVFYILDVMDVAKVVKDVETFEFIARAAVAMVTPKAIVDSWQTLPAPHFPEIVLLGQSNVGKSSLVNSLLHRRALASVAAMPGHTTRFHFYDVNETRASFPRMTLVDVPGLGVAVADQEQIDHWKATLFQYLRERGPALRGIMHLVSGEEVVTSRRISSIDIEVLSMARKLPVEYTLVLTKVDTLQGSTGKPAYRAVSQWLRRKRLRIDVVASSTKTCEGRDLLWRRLWSCVDPDNPRWQGRDLLGTKLELDELADSSELVARTVGLEGDAWEYAVRRLLQLGDLAAAWSAVEAAVEGPLVDRTALLVGEAALAAGDRPLAEQALVMLRQRGVAAELLLEFAVVDTRDGDEAAFQRAMGIVQEILDLAAQGGDKPWNVDRWNSLLRGVLQRRELAAFKIVLEAMAKLKVKETAETRVVMAQATISSVSLVATGRRVARGTAPEVLAVTDIELGNGSFLHALLAERAEVLADKSFKGLGRDVYSLELNSESDAVIPRTRLVDLPAITSYSNAAVLPLFARKPAVFHLLTAAAFVRDVRAALPDQGRPSGRRYARSVWLPPGDVDIQRAVLSQGVSHYTLVITEVEKLGLDPLAHDSSRSAFAHPTVFLQREELLVKELAQEIEETQRETGAKVDSDVILIDARSRRGLTSLYRRLWECALPPVPA